MFEVSLCLQSGQCACQVMPAWTRPGSWKVCLAESSGGTDQRCCDAPLGRGGGLAELGDKQT